MSDSPRINLPQTRRIHVQGVVQGVGMRPFVYRLATERGLAGWVCNAADGVHIEARGQEHLLDDFERALVRTAPPAACIEQMRSQSVELVAGEHGHEAHDTSARAVRAPEFEIRASCAAGEASTLVSPDLATCDACLRELHDPADRRYRYPFINCTNCGPRFTIIERLPYDRPGTSMAGFAMCPSCEEEYHDPADRRFHAQPDACFDCGPRLTLLAGDRSETARTREESDRLITRAAQLLAEGGILAVKALGGYHLVCDATNEAAVCLLRARKRRPARPLAVMVASLEAACALCEASEQEAALLASVARPIVLLRRSQAGEAAAQVAPSVAGPLPELGVMLPSTPLQHLLIEASGRPLVMTSGNMSHEPIIADELEAHRRLQFVADAFLDNDRPIRSRYDDSVVRVIAGRTHVIRRARGYAPLPCPLPDAAVREGLPAILATGAEQKSSFCVTRGSEAFVSQHLGDLEDADTFSNYRETIGLYTRLFGLSPAVCACDSHPTYQASMWARKSGMPLVEVQHHHAHIAAVMAENAAASATVDPAAAASRVIGIAFDGTGAGDDGAVWGGEVLVASFESFKRFAHLAYLPLPGAQAAITHPDRMAFALLHACGLLDHPGARDLLDHLGPERCTQLAAMIEGGINTPATSSMGRLFDAVSALLGVVRHSTYDGQPAIELEAALHADGASSVAPESVAGSGDKRRYRFGLVSGRGERVESQVGGRGGERGGWLDGGLDGAAPVVFDPRPVVQALLDDLLVGFSVARLSRCFHDAVCVLVVDAAAAARRATGLSTVALSGGVFMNRYLVERAVPLLESAGFTVLLHRDLPANDGCIAYGQATVAACRLADRSQHGILTSLEPPLGCLEAPSVPATNQNGT
ncbi:MAG: carbamoyltransferase HypF [Coriobacteriales bacterium]|jgi:hydrogenase maturation protein HypF|nr:carbamoyltransferase HypF [Coriobacteriales bacterium]